MFPLRQADNINMLGWGNTVQNSVPLLLKYIYSALLF